MTDGEDTTQMKPGTRVRVAGWINPKYMIGATGTVVAKRSDKYVTVRLDVGRGKYHGVVGFPTSTLEIIEEGG